jgi:hypothetical protein
MTPNTKAQTVLIPNKDASSEPAAFAGTVEEAGVALLDLVEDCRSVVDVLEEFIPTPSAGTFRVGNEVEVADDRVVNGSAVVDAATLFRVCAGAAFPPVIVITC